MVTQKGVTSSCFVLGKWQPLLEGVEQNNPDVAIVVDDSKENSIFKTSMDPGNTVPIMVMDEALDFMENVRKGSVNVQKLCKLYDSGYWSTTKGKEAKRLQCNHAQMTRWNRG